MMNLENWELMSDRDGIPIYTYEGENNLTGMYGTVEIDACFEAIMHYTSNGEDIISWNPMAEEVQIIDDLDYDTKVGAISYRGLLIVAGREVIVIVTRLTLPNGKQCYVLYSIDDHPNEPPLKNGRVRGHVEIGGWIYDYVDENKTIVTNFAIGDPRGFIPMFVAKAGAITQRTLMSRLRGYVKQKVNDGTILTPEQFVEINKNNPWLMKDYKKIKDAQKESRKDN